MAKTAAALAPKTVRRQSAAVTTKLAAVPKLSGEPIKTIDSGIAPDYATKNWALPQAIREWYQNAKDTDTDTKADWTNGFSFIEDAGPGLTVANLVLGNSEKKADSSKLGQFGEGAKMGLKVAAELKRPHGIETTGFTIVAEVRKSETFSVRKTKTTERKDVYTLHYLVYKNSRKHGTLVWCKTTKAEHDSGLAYFLERTGLTPLDAALGLYSKPEGQQGILFIAGVKTQQIPSIISYNLPDKRLINRDRNFSDLNLVNEKIRQAWGSTKAVEAVRHFLKQIQNPANAQALENLLDISPVQKGLWLTEAKKLWKQPVLSGNGPEYDVAAKLAGYTVLRNMPQGLVRILERVGVGKSHQVVPDPYKPMEFKDRFILTINPNWSAEMTMAQVLRELTSNCLDAAKLTPGDKFKTPTWKDGYAEFTNTKAKLLPKHLILGIGDANGKLTIGRFHTGLKQAMAVVTRNNRKMTLELAGETLEVTKEYDEDFGATLIVLMRNKTAKRQGTTIRVQCSENEFNSMIAMFPALSKAKYLDEGILAGASGKLYVKGVLVKSDLKSLLSYDLPDGAVVSMDRKTIDESRMLQGVALILGATKNKDVAKSILTGYRSIASWNNPQEYVEYRVSPKFTVDAKKAWTSVMNKEFAKTCLSTFGKPEYDQQAQYKGWKVLSNVPGTLTTTLRTLGLKQSDQVVRLPQPNSEQPKNVAKTKLDTQERKNLAVAEKLIKTFFPDDAKKPIKVVEEAAPNGSRVTLWLYVAMEDTIYLNRKLLKGKTPELLIALVGTMAHEQAHRVSGANDFTENFQWALSVMAGYGFAVAMKLGTQKNLKAAFKPVLKKSGIQSLF